MHAYVCMVHAYVLYGTYEVKVKLNYSSALYF